MISYQQVTDCCDTALDGFLRHQVVTDCWRRIDGEYQLVPCPFVDDWSAQRRREKVHEMLDSANVTYGAYDGERIVGFATVVKQLNEKRMILDSMQVSEDYRHRGIGRKLFTIAMEAGRRAGAEALYISACSSRETIAFYKAMGCALSQNVIAEMAENEPFDLQLECGL